MARYLVLLQIFTGIALSSTQNTDFIWFEQTIAPTHHSGITFEKLQNITFTQDYRNLTVMIDLEIREQDVIDLEKAFRELRTQLGFAIPENYTVFTPVFENLYSRFREIKESIKFVKLVREMPSTMHEGKLIQNRLKAGILDKPEFEKGGSIFIESALSRKMKQLMQDRSEIYAGIGGITKVTRDSSRIKKNRYFTEVYTTLTYTIEQLGKSLLNFKAIKTALLEIKDLKLGTNLIDKNDLQQIELSFNNYYRTCKFPVKGIINAAELNQWVDISYGVDKERIYVEIQIPCVNKKRVDLYEVKPMPIPQIINDAIHSAYIEPQSRYMLVSGSSYYHLSYEELQTCKQGT